MKTPQLSTHQNRLPRDVARADRAGCIIINVKIFAKMFEKEWKRNKENETNYGKPADGFGLHPGRATGNGQLILNILQPPCVAQYNAKPFCELHATRIEPGLRYTSK